MIINKLELTSFGKFQQKEISFEQGFNILEGDNEIGKTTIHKFIEGMLFGFLDPTKSRRSYTDDHQKYQPKNASDYRGSMMITVDKKTYRIDRNFDKKQADVKLYDVQNGEDLTNKLNIHPSIKLPDISEFIGISYKLYANTISTSQLLRNTEKDLGQALIERLHNITTTKDESISIKEVHNELNKTLAEIGSEKAKTKPYAKAIETVEKLNNKIELSKQKYEQSERLFSEKNHKQKEILETKNDLEQINQDIHQYYNTKKKEQYKKANNLKKQLENNEMKIETNQSTLNLSEDKYEELQHIKNELKHQQQKKAELQNTDEELKNALKSYEEILSEHPTYSNYQQSIYQFRDLFYARKNIAEDIETLSHNIDVLETEISGIDINQDITQNHQEVERLKEEKEALDIGILEQNLYQKKQKYEQLKEKTFSPIITVVFYLLYLLIIGIFLQKNRQTKIKTHQLQLSQAKELFLQAEESLIQEKAKQKELGNMIEERLIKHEVAQVHQLSELRRKEELKQQAKETKEAQKDDLTKELQKHQRHAQEIEEEFTRHCALLDLEIITNKEELENFEQTFMRHQKAQEQYVKTKKETTKNNEEIEYITKQIHLLEQNYKEILIQNNMETSEQFKMALKVKQEMLQLQKENELIASRMFDLTDGLVLEEFEKDIHFDLEDFQKNESIKDLEESQTNLRKQLRTKESEIYELEKEISIIEETYTDVYTLKAMLSKAEHDLSEIKKEKEAYELADQIIDELSKEIQYEFAPSLNQAISNVMKEITGGKYYDLKIDPETNIKIVDDYLKQLLIAKDFSTGTIDQIYFSMRLGLSKVLYDQSFPYLLDDTFVNYDQTRLRHVLHLLAKEERQILLFTCHKREHLIALEEEINHHYLPLT